MNIVDIFFPEINILILSLPVAFLFVEWRRTGKRTQLLFINFLIVLGLMELIFNPSGHAFGNEFRNPPSIFSTINILIFGIIVFMMLFDLVKKEEALFRWIGGGFSIIIIMGLTAMYFEMIQFEGHQTLILVSSLGTGFGAVALAFRVNFQGYILISAVSILSVFSSIAHPLFFPIYYLGLSLLIIRYNLKDIQALDVSNTRLIHEKKITFELINRIGNEISEVNRYEGILELVLKTAIQTTLSEAGAFYLISSEDNELELVTFQGPYIPLEHEENTKLIGKQFEKKLYKKSGKTLGRNILKQLDESSTGGVILKGTEQVQLVKLLGESAYHIRNLCAGVLKIKNELLGVFVIINKRFPAETFYQEDLGLIQSLGNQAALGIHMARVYESLTEGERMKRELEIAEQIQSSLLPKEIPKLAGFHCAADMIPAQEVGGDYYDVIQLGENRMGLVIGDVAGKGVPAGMVMLMVRTIIHAIITDLASPLEVISMLSKRIYPQMDSKQFMTLLYLVWDKENKTLRYASAGHEHILHYKSSTNKIERIRSGGLAIGMHPEIEQFVVQKEIHLDKNDVVVLYTDGITEARNNYEKMYGLDRLQAIFQNNARLEINNLRGKILQDVNDFRDGAKQYDDITLLAFKID